MIKIKSDFFRVSSGVKLCDLFINLVDIDYERTAECTVPVILGFLSNDRNAPPIYRLLKNMESSTEKAAVNALSAFSDKEKDALFTSAALSFGDMANSSLKEHDLCIGTLSEYDIGGAVAAKSSDIQCDSGKQRFNISLDIYTLERRCKISSANVTLRTDSMKELNDYISDSLRNIPSAFTKIGLGLAGNSFILGKLLNLYLPTLNKDILMPYGIVAENLTVK